MRRCVLLLAGLVLTIVTLILPAVAEKRVALVIGNDTYPNLKTEEQLRKAGNDADAVGKALRELRFEVIGGANVTRFEFNKKLQELAQSLTPGDTAALFFSGHGVQIQNANFLLPSDIPEFQAGDEELLKRESISLQGILDMLNEKGTRINIVILDACRNNPFSDPKLKSAGGTRGLARVDPPAGTFVMFSAGSNQTALDRLSDGDPDANSVYTRRLLPLLKLPNTPIQSIAKKIQVEVRDLAKEINHEQVPAYYDEVVGDFVLNPAASADPAAIAAEPPPQPQPPKPGIDPRKRLGEVAYLECVRSNDLACYKQFLTDYFDHPRSEQVEKIITSQIETPLYQSCIESTTATGRISTCQGYLDAFPDGQYAAHARELLEEGKKAVPPIASLPPPTPPTPPPEDTPPPADAEVSGPAIPPAGGGRWYVILGSFPHWDHGSASGRQAYLRQNGVRARLIDTDQYGGFTPGYYAVVLGPYAKGVALRTLSTAKALVGDAYIKSGR